MQGLGPIPGPFPLDGLTLKQAVGLRMDQMKFRKPNDEGNEPSPLIMIAVAVVPLLAVAGWFLLR